LRKGRCLDGVSSNLVEHWGARRGAAAVAEEVDRGAAATVRDHLECGHDFLVAEVAVGVVGADGILGFVLVAVESGVCRQLRRVTFGEWKEVARSLCVSAVVGVSIASGEAASAADRDSERKEILLAGVVQETEALGLVPVELRVVVVRVEVVDGAVEVVGLVLRGHGHATPTP